MIAAGTGEISLSFMLEGNLFHSFVDFLACLISMFLFFFARPIDRVMGIVVYKCRCIK